MLLVVVDPDGSLGGWVAGWLDEIIVYGFASQTSWYLLILLTDEPS